MIKVSYAGGDRLRIAVRGHELYADQPPGDGGDDAGPTPSEMFVSSLAACVAFFAERFLRRHGMSPDGLEVSCDYAWAENPHRIGAIDLVVEAPGLQPERRDAFLRVIDHCTVHNSLRMPPEVNVRVALEQDAAA